MEVWLTFVGVLVVAVITAVTTDRRQERALRHGRELADLAELRAIVDDAAGKLAEAVDAVTNAQTRLQIPPGEGEVDEFARLATEAHSHAMDCIFVLYGRAVLLSTRVGKDHPLVGTYYQARQALAAWGEVAAPLLSIPYADREFEVLMPPFRAAGAAYGAFIDQAYAIVHSKTPS